MDLLREVSVWVPAGLMEVPVVELQQNAKIVTKSLYVNGDKIMLYTYRGVSPQTILFYTVTYTYIDTLTPKGITSSFNTPGRLSYI